MRRFILITGTLMILSSCNNARVDTVAIDKVFTEQFDAKEPGAAVLVMKGDETVFEKCYGMAALPDVPVTPETSFNIGSISKQFTAVAILQLCQQGKMTLDDKVRDYFPDYKPSIWDDIRVKHLLNHSSGVPELRSKLYTLEQRIYCDDDLAVAYFPALDTLEFTPGTAYRYMNPTFVLLGKIVEKVSGEEFTEYMQKHIFSPAGMSNTLYFDPEHQELIPNRSHGYLKGDDGSWELREYGNETCFATRPDGGIYTSLRDFAKWEKALRTDLVLEEKWKQEAWTPHIEVSGSPYSSYNNRPGTWYGYGWFLEGGNGKEDIIYHTGENGGYAAIAARYPRSETLIAILSNNGEVDLYALLKKIEGFCVNQETVSTVLK